MIIFDIETNGINPDKIHCMVFRDTDDDVSKCTATDDYDYMRDVLLSAKGLVQPTDGSSINCNKSTAISDVNDVPVSA